MAQDWAKDLLRTFPLTTAVKADLWDAAYDDDWDTFTAKLTAAVQPKTERDQRLLDARLLRADRARQAANAAATAPPQTSGLLDRAGDVLFRSVIGRQPAFPTAAQEARSLQAERLGQPPLDMGYARGPAEAGAMVAERLRSGLMGEADRRAELEEMTAQEAAVLAQQRAGMPIAPQTLEGLDARLAAARQAPSTGRALFSAALSAPAATAGVLAESATSPMGLLSFGVGAIPATAPGTAAMLGRNLGGAAVGLGTGLGAQQSIQNARQAFAGGTPEQQIMAATDVAATGLGLAAGLTPTRLGQARPQDLPAVARQIRQDRQTTRQAKRDIKRDIQDQSALNTAAPKGKNKPLSGMRQDDMSRLRNLVASGARRLGMTPETLPEDLDGFTAMQDALEASIGQRYDIFQTAGESLLRNYTTAQGNVDTALANAGGDVNAPAVQAAQRRAARAQNRAFVTIRPETLQGKLASALKESPQEIAGVMAYLKKIGDPTNPDAPPTFTPATIPQALDRVRYINAQLKALNRLGEQGATVVGKRRVSANAQATALMFLKDELHQAIGQKLEVAGIKNLKELQQDIAVGTKIKNRLFDNEFTKNDPAVGEVLTLPERFTLGMKVAAPVAGFGLVGAALGEPLAGTILGGGFSAPAMGRFVGRQMGYEGRGNTKAQVATKLFQRFLEEGTETPLPTVRVPPVPSAAVAPGVTVPPPAPELPSRDAQIAQAMRQGPPVPLVKETVLDTRSGGSRTVYQVLNPLTGILRPVETFAGVGARAKAEAFAKTYAQDKRYRQLFERLMEGFDGSDVELQGYIATLRGQKPPSTPSVVSSPQSSPTGSPSAAPLPPVRTETATLPLTTPAPTAAPSRPAEPPRQTTIPKVSVDVEPVAGPPSAAPLITPPFEPESTRLTPMGEFLLRWMATDSEFRWKDEVGGAAREAGKLSKYLAEAGRKEGWVPSADPRWTRTLMAKKLHELATSGDLPPSVQQWVKVLSIAWDPATRKFDITRVGKADFPPGIKTQDQLRKAMPEVMSLSEVTTNPSLNRRLPALGEPVLELFGDLAEMLFADRMYPDDAPPF